MSGRFSVAVITSTFPFGRGEEFLREELFALDQLGCDVTVLPAAPRGGRISHNDITDTMRIVRFPLLGIYTFIRAFRGLRRNLQGAVDALVTILRSKTAIRAKIKNVVLFPTGLAVADELCLHPVDHIHGYWLTGPSTVAFIAANVTGISWSFTAHSGDIFLEQNLIEEKLTAAKFGRAISNMAKNEILKRVRGIPSSKLDVIHLGVKVSEPKYINRRETRHQVTLLCPAYFEPCKGHIYLFQTLRLLADRGLKFRCTLAGDGPLRSRLTREIESLKLKEVVCMPGMIDHPELLRQLHSDMFDLVVLASVDLEGIPVALMEAMEAGVPCIATRTGAIGELIDDRCGILLHQRDSRAMADAIATLASDPELRKELGERARERVARLFDAKQSARALLNKFVN